MEWPTRDGLKPDDARVKITQDFANDECWAYVGRKRDFRQEQPMGMKEELIKLVFFRMNFEVYGKVSFLIEPSTIVCYTKPCRIFRFLTKFYKFLRTGPTKTCRILRILTILNSDKISLRLERVEDRG